MNKLILVSLLLCPILASAGDVNVLFVPDEAPFREGVRVRENIKTECGLERFVADDIARNASNAYSRVVREKPTGGAYHVLSLEIVSVFGNGGGAWSGPKNLEIRGTLKDHNGSVVGSFSAERFSMGGAFGGFKGTCKILRRISKVLGKDVAQFLVSPEEGVVMSN